MDYQSLLRVGLYPSCVLFVASLAAIVLNAHYWVLGDWIMGRWIRVTDTANGNKFIDIIIYYSDKETNATISALSLSFAAGIVTFVGWYKLRRNDMDMDYNLHRRRTYVGAILLLTFGSFITCIAALILDYTQWGSDKEFIGCSSQFRNEPDWNLWCTREAAACNVLNKAKQLKVKDEGGHTWAPGLACNEIKAVKWMLVPLMVCDVIIFTLFLWQALNRRRTRYERVGDKTVVPQVKYS